MSFQVNMKGRIIQWKRWTINSTSEEIRNQCHNIYPYISYGNIDWKVY